MKLIYRGITYDYTPANSQAKACVRESAPIVQPVYHLRYRGSNYDLDADRTARRSVFQAIAGLMYRGVAYSWNG